ncbi:uncharacterized protein V1518DRAFT_420690 [Limtongia smithiae]|uniref:uncharacterized protein n=1 Tax=Limtongia smithiae TaxID=1125753 RepID=UPI0034CD4994
MPPPPPPPSATPRRVLADISCNIASQGTTAITSPQKRTQAALTSPMKLRVLDPLPSSPAQVMPLPRTTAVPVVQLTLPEDTNNNSNNNPPDASTYAPPLSTPAADAQVHADRLRMRLRLAHYKIRTNQRNTPFADLTHASPPSTSALSVTSLIAAAAPLAQPAHHQFSLASPNQAHALVEGAIAITGLRAFAPAHAYHRRLHTSTISAPSTTKHRHHRRTRNASSASAAAAKATPAAGRTSMAFMTRELARMDPSAAAISDTLRLAAFPPPAPNSTVSGRRRRPTTTFVYYSHPAAIAAADAAAAASIAAGFTSPHPRRRTYNKYTREPPGLASIAPAALPPTPATATASEPAAGLHFTEIAAAVTAPGKRTRGRAAQEQRNKRGATDPSLMMTPARKTRHTVEGGGDEEDHEYQDDDDAHETRRAPTLAAAAAVSALDRVSLPAKDTPSNAFSSPLKNAVPSSSIKGTPNQIGAARSLLELGCL